MKTITKYMGPSMAALAAAAAAMLTGVAPAHADSCTVNLYQVNHSPAGVWTLDGQWIENKSVGDIVTGPNSNVAPISTANGWRKVYLANGHTAQMYPGYLDYRSCR